jgi:hypothetical protein
VGREWTPGVVFDLTWKGDPNEAHAAAADATTRVARFRALASREAQRLAAAFAASPVSTLGVLRLLRRDLLPGANPFAEAEVLLGGLLLVRREDASWDAGAALPLRFHDGVRPLLQDAAVAGDVLRVLTHAAHEAGSGVRPTFTAWLHDPSSGSGQLDPAESDFAAAAARVLERLGGRYAQIVKGSPTVRVTQGGVEVPVQNAVADATTTQTPSEHTEFEVETQTWQGDRAILVVHGVSSGQSRPPPVLNQLRELLAREGSDGRVLPPEAAMYEVRLDHVDDWIASRGSVGPSLGRIHQVIASRIGGEPAYQSAAAQTVTDLIWPVLSWPMRRAARDQLIAQLQQIVKDGLDAGVAPPDQKLSIICHSLGAFHTYEALHLAATTPSLGLQPETHGVRFETVVCVASPVQLIRSLSLELDRLIEPLDLQAGRGTSLSLPAQTASTSTRSWPSVRRWVSVVGELDPVGGYDRRQRSDWGFMNIAGQETLVDDQRTLNLDAPGALTDVLRNALRPGRASPSLLGELPRAFQRIAAAVAG